MCRHSNRSACDLGFTTRQDYFNSFWADSMDRWGENGRSEKKHLTIRKQKVCLVSHVTRGRPEKARNQSGEMTDLAH